MEKVVRSNSFRFGRYWSLKPNTVFFNHGSFGACPKPILALQTKLRAQMEAEPVQFLWRHLDERLEIARRDLAKFVGANSRDLVFVANATTGVNAVLRSLKFRRGDEILTTNLDYNACRNVLVEATERAGVRFVVAKIPFPLKSPEEITEAILRALTPKTRLAMFDHVTSNTALIFPAREIIRALQARGVDVLVDGAHAPGMLPVNLRELNSAYYTANLHKWVCAPKGAAFLYVREDLQSQIQPPVISHGNNRSRPGFTRFQDRFDWPGTFDPSAWLCVGEAIRWMGNLLPGGWRELRERNHQLVVRARRLLCEKLEVEPPCPEKMLGSMAVLPMPERFQNRPRIGKIDAEQLELYDRFGIEVPLSRFGEPERRWFRVSAQIYNTPADFEYLASAFNEL